jgi:hypothetical protein
MFKNVSNQWFTIEEILSRYPDDMWGEVIIAMAMNLTSGVVELRNGKYRLSESARLEMLGYTLIGGKN